MFDGPKITEMSLEELQASAIAWFEAHIWTISTLQQSVVIIGVLLLSWLIHRITAAKFVTEINKRQIPVRIKQLLHNLRRLVFPFTAFLLLFGTMLLSATPIIGFSTKLIDVAMNLTLAWVVIRLVLQVISNSFIRNMCTVIIWIIAALSIFNVLDETTAALDSMGLSFGDVRISALTIVKGLFALFVLLYAAGFLSTLAERRVRSISGLTMTSKVLISKVIRIVLITFALLIGITTAGIDLSLFAVFSGAVGLGIGFGLQKGVSNLFAGMMLLVDKSIKPGDIIEVQNPQGGSTFGWVNHMGARYTELITRDNKSYLVPNEDFITTQVVNWSHGDTLIRVDVEFGVHYESDPHEVRKVAIKAAQNTNRVVDDNSPVCHITEFGDSSINFILRFWIKDAENGLTNVKGDVMLSLWDELKENNISIPYPHREVFIHDTKK